MLRRFGILNVAGRNFGTIMSTQKSAQSLKK